MRKLIFKDKIKKENGSMAVYVTVVLLTMLILISSIFMVSSATKKSQLETAYKIKQSYESDNSKAAQIYDNITGR